MKKIMFFLPELRSGGGQKLVVEIIKKIQSSDFKIQILCLGKNEGNFLDIDARDNGIDVVYLNKSKGLDLTIIPKIYRVIKSFSPDIIHAHLPRMHYLIIPMLVAGVKHKYYTIHSLAEKEECGILAKKALWFAFHFCGVKPIAITPCCRESAAKFYHYPIEKIRLIYNGVDIRKFLKPESIGTNDDGLIKFIAVGRFMPAKNHLFMLKAFKKLYELYPQARLLLLGEGENRGVMEEFCRENGLSDVVSMPGAVSNVYEYMWKADIFIMTSDYEGMPVVVLEAMAAELPVVSSCAGGVVDIISDGEDGLLFPVGDLDAAVESMAKMAASKELRSKIAAAGKNKVKQFDIEKCASEHRKVYLNS